MDLARLERWVSGPDETQHNRRVGRNREPGWRSVPGLAGCNGDMRESWTIHGKLFASWPDPRSGWIIAGITCTRRCLSRCVYRIDGRDVLEER